MNASIKPGAIHYTLSRGSTYVITMEIGAANTAYQTKAFRIVIPVNNRVDPVAEEISWYEKPAATL